MNKLINLIQPNKFYIAEQGGGMCDPYQKWIFFITEIDHDLSDEDEIYYKGIIIMLDTDDDIDDIDQIYLEMSDDEPIMMPNIDIDDSEITEITKDQFIKYLDLFKNKKEFDDVKYTEVDLEDYQATCYFENEKYSPNYHAVMKDKMLAKNVYSEFLNPNIADFKEDSDYIESEKSYFDKDWNNTISTIEEMIS